MARITFLPSGTEVEAEAGWTLLNAARKAGLVLEAPCNGSGTCGKCLVKLRTTNGDSRVLACQTLVQHNAVVEVASAWEDESVRVLDDGVSEAGGIDPFIAKRLSGDGRETVVFAGEKEIGRERGDTRGRLFGVVIDIGTTTLVATLVSLRDGKEVASVSALNPQSLHGQDVLSRIKLASTREGLSLLFRLFLDEARRMVDELAGQAGIAAHDIYEVVYSGNTAMLHLATGTDPSPLGRYPYVPSLRGGEALPFPRGEKLGIADRASLYLPPVISGFVGADITSGVLATRLHERKGITLFIDIGTNGEMVLADRGRLVATSTAAGPAFEGMNITFGMRAGTGAVESFGLDGEKEPAIGTIGNVEPKGICGSGLLDVVGELVAHGAIDKNGRLGNGVNGSLPPALKERLGTVAGKPVFSLSDAVYLSQGDVRQVQLAKGAIRAGVEYLLRDAGIGPADVDEVLIAGAFGFHLREKNLLAIGLLPPTFEGRIRFVGNTSKTGGIAFLLNKRYRAEMKEIVGAVRTIELADFADFDRTFVGFLRF